MILVFLKSLTYLNLGVNNLSGMVPSSIICHLSLNLQQLKIICLEVFWQTLGPVFLNSAS